MASGGSALPQRYCSVDVECVATGRRHDDRSVAYVAVVDNDETLLLKKKVRVEKPIVSYLTPLTGLRAGDLDNGESLASVIRQVKSLLGRDVVLVGQGVWNDIKWLELQQGIDFDFAVDLGKFFKVYNPKYRNFNFFSLEHEANTLLGPGTMVQTHDPENDARVSIKLFKKYYANPALKSRDEKQLIYNRPPPSWAKRNGYRWEGVCMASYMPDKCFCGAPTLHTD